MIRTGKREVILSARGFQFFKSHFSLIWDKNQKFSGFPPKGTEPRHHRPWVRVHSMVPTSSMPHAGSKHVKMLQSSPAKSPKHAGRCRLESVHNSWTVQGLRSWVPGRQMNHQDPGRRCSPAAQQAACQRDRRPDRKPGRSHPKLSKQLRLGYRLGPN